MKYHEKPAHFRELFSNLLPILLALFIWTNPVLAQNNGELITLSLKNKTIGEALETINKRYNYTFVLRTPDIDTKRKVSIDAKQQKIEDVLNNLFRGQDVSFDINNKTVRISKNVRQKDAESTQGATARNVTGQVTDSSGEPMIGVSVMVKGSNNGVVTNMDGIVVLPMGEEINTFTPVQHPANDMTVDITTTHFDYHSIDHNLLKLDILGHDDPTMIRMLQDLTGVDPTKIPLDDKAVMSLFQNTSALGIEPEDIDGCPLGALGIPEFGTDFAMGMLLDTKPKEFSDLIRIAGLSHGTDVWLGNAQTLIEEGTATISTCICTRDDIMTYLISMGLESEEAFNIMEKVRKGIIAKGKCPQWPQWKEDMKAHGVPDWYIWSCEKIKYMFPKAHAAAYVMMAWRIAYCKVFYPLAYYAAYFSIRATGFSYELMCQGKDRLENYMKDYKKRKDTLSNKEQDVFKDMRIVQEMYARGFDFMPLDIYRAHPNRFQIIDGKLMPAINSIDGLGDNAAIYISEAAKDGPFLSKDDFRERTHVSRTAVDLMSDLGLLGSLPESNQLSLFDFGA